MTDLYFCPTAGEVESAAHGGFSTCCDAPERHLPMPDTAATTAVSAALDKAARQAFQAKQVGQAVTRIRALHEPYRSVYDTDGQSCAHCNQLTGYAVPYPCDSIRALDGEGAPSG